MMIANALLLVGGATVLVGVFGGRISPGLGRRKGLILVLGLIIAVIGVVLHPEFSQGYQDAHHD